MKRLSWSTINLTKTPTNVQGSGRRLTFELRWNCCSLGPPQPLRSKWSAKVNIKIVTNHWINYKSKLFRGLALIPMPYSAVWNQKIYLLLQYLQNMLFFHSRCVLETGVLASTAVSSHPTNNFENCFLPQNLNFNLKINFLLLSFSLTLVFFNIAFGTSVKSNLFSVFLQLKPN